MKIYWNEIDKDFWCEVKYLENISNKVLDELPELSIIVTPHHKPIPKVEGKKIVIVTGDELGTLPKDYFRNDKNILGVFRIFNKIGWFDNDFVFPIPPGYNWTMHNNRENKMKKIYPEKKISERDLDIFFAGQMLPLRRPLVDKLNQLKDSYNIICNVNPSFRTGFHIDEYYQLLGNCKISTCPDGTAVDTFRYVESFASGNIVIATKKDMNLWYYRDSPAIFINSWQELNETLIKSLLEREDLREKGLEYYNKYLSEEAVSNYIINNIKNRI